MNTGDQKTASQNTSLQRRAKQIPLNKLPELLFLRDQQEIPWLSVSECPWVHMLAGSAQNPANQTPQELPKWLNKAAWHKNCWPSLFFFKWRQNMSCDAAARPRAHRVLVIRPRSTHITAEQWLRQSECYRDANEKWLNNKNLIYFLSEDRQTIQWKKTSETSG